MLLSFFRKEEEAAQRQEVSAHKQINNNTDDGDIILMCWCSGKEWLNLLEYDLFIPGGAAIRSLKC